MMKLENDHPYSELTRVLAEALDDAAIGKGRERHANPSERFEDQPIAQLGAWMKSNHFEIGQACKKAIESTRLPFARAKAELLGAINYLAAGVLVLERIQEWERGAVQGSESKTVPRGEPTVILVEHQVERPSADDVLQAGRKAAVKALHVLAQHTGGFYRMCYPGGAEIVGHGKPGEASAPTCGTCKNWQHFERNWGHCRKMDNVDTTDDCVHHVCPGHEPVADAAVMDADRPSTTEGIAGSPEPEKTCGTCTHWQPYISDSHGYGLCTKDQTHGVRANEAPLWCPGHEPKLL